MILRLHNMSTLLTKVVRYVCGVHRQAGGTVDDVSRGFERLGDTFCSNLCPVLSERLFYYVVALMSSILKPHSNF